jgi:hypothetical protein
VQLVARIVYNEILWFITMTNNAIIGSIRVSILAAAFILMGTAWGCRCEIRENTSKPEDAPTEAETGGNGDQTETGGTSGTGDQAETGGTSRGGTSGSDPETPSNCPIADPPLPDPYCYNLACPLADLPTITRDNRPMGDCCNTVDVRQREESMAPGTRYDLEFAMLVSLPQNNPNVAADIVTGVIQQSQLEGGDVTLLRLKNVPRTADMTQPVSVTLEVNSGKLNCDGTYSFYGPNGASAPVHEGPPNDPSRWVKRIVRLDYNGFNAERLVEMPAEDALAQAGGLIWVPRWNPSSLDYEQPLKFYSFVLKNDPNNWSCYGSMDSSGTWTLKAKLMLFIPVQEAKLTLIPNLSLQSECGLLAKGVLQGECDDDRSYWTTKPTGYCDDEHKCWIGDPSDPDYADFWLELYPDQDGCGAAYPCCDPEGMRSSIRPCNAFYIRNSAVVAAVDITDDESNDPAQANSHRSRCE